MNNFTFYPRLDSTQIKKLKCSIDSLSFAYECADSKIDLRYEAESVLGSTIISVVDDSGKWSLDDFGFSVNGVFNINNIEILFGSEGIVPKDAVLGIGLVWKSKTTNIRGSKMLCSLDESTDSSMGINFNLKFDKAQLRGVIELSFQLFIIEAGTGNTNLPTGLSLGELNTCSIILEGIGSTFTVFEKSIPGDVLWTVDCTWTDSSHDQFSECVCVKINKAHKAWQLSTDDDMRKELLKEIMASSMQVVISHLMSENESFLNDDNEPGSVGAAIEYIYSRASIDLSSDESIAKSIRTYLDKTMK